MPLGRQHQPARRGEIERLGIARNLADDKGQRAASYALLHGPERIGCIARRDMDEVATLLGRKTVKIGPPAPPNAAGILHPQPSAILVDAILIDAILVDMAAMRPRKSQSQRLTGSIVGR